MNGTEDLIEGTTKDMIEELTDSQKLSLLLARFSSMEDRQTRMENHLISIDERLTRLEAAEEDRARETRPLWQRLDGQMVQVMVELTALKDQQKRTRREIIVLREEFHRDRVDRAELAERVSDLERLLPDDLEEAA